MKPITFSCVGIETTPAKNDDCKKVTIKLLDNQTGHQKDCVLFASEEQMYFKAEREDEESVLEDLEDGICYVHLPINGELLVVSSGVYMLSDPERTQPTHVVVNVEELTNVILAQYPAMSTSECEAVIDDAITLARGNYADMYVFVCDEDDLTHNQAVLSFLWYAVGYE